MKVLLLAASELQLQVAPLVASWEAVCDLKVEWVGPSRRKQVGATLSAASAQRVDRVILWFPFDSYYRHIMSLRKIPHLVLVDYEYNESRLGIGAVASKRDTLVKALPWARFVSFSWNRKESLLHGGGDAVWVPPFLQLIASESAPDEVTPTPQPDKTIGVCMLSDIEAISNKRHKELLYDVRRELKIHMIDDAEPAAQKNHILTKSAMCVVDDLSFGGMRAQSVSAFMAECVVLLWVVNREECRALGLVDMENVALVDSKESLVAKVNYLKRHKDQANLIAAAGKAWAEALVPKASEALLGALEPGFGEYTGDNAWGGLRYLFCR